MRSITLALILGLPVACSPKPPADLAEVAQRVAESDWGNADAAVGTIISQATGCELAQGHALASGLQRAQIVPAVLEPNIDEMAVADAMKASFFAGYEDAIAQANRMSDCNLRSLSAAELQIGG